MKTWRGIVAHCGKVPGLPLMTCVPMVANNRHALPLISRTLVMSSYLPNQISSATFLTGSVNPNTSQ